MWLACNTQQEIADAVGVPKGTIDALCLELADMPKVSKTQQVAAEHATDFEVPIYNIQKQQTKCSAIASHHANNVSTNSKSFKRSIALLFIADRILKLSGSQVIQLCRPNVK